MLNHGALIVVEPRCVAEDLCLGIYDLWMIVFTVVK